MKWVRAEVEANRIESVTIRRDFQTGAIGLLVVWHGPGLITSWVNGETLEECFSKLERIQLPDQTWAAMMRKKRQNHGQELSFETYLRSIGVKK